MLLGCQKMLQGWIDPESSSKFLSRFILGLKNENYFQFSILMQEDVAKIFVSYFFSFDRPPENTDWNTYVFMMLLA